MKAPYEELEFEVIRFTVEDIITTSNAQTDDDDKDQDTDKDQDDQGGNEDDGGNDGTSETEQGETNQIPDGYTATGDNIPGVDGTGPYPEYRKDGEYYYWDGKEMIGPLV